MAERFHVNCDLAPGQLVIEGPEAHHLSAVCRARTGDAVVLFNGDGREYPGRVVAVTRREVTVEVLAVASPERERRHPLHIAAPLPRGDRAQFLVEKLTELGVGSLHLVLSERTVVQPREAKVEKLARYVIEASKQCGRNVLMRIEPPRPWGVIAADATLPPCRLLAHPGAETSVEAVKVAGLAVAAVGPEGGFTDAEVAQALACGWQAVNLGPRTLRVETAALVLAAVVGRFSREPVASAGPRSPQAHG